MNKNLKSFFSLFLVVVLCCSFVLPAYATNDKGVTFIATLDKTSIVKSDTDQTVTLTVTTNKPVTMDGIGGTAYSNGGISVTSFAGGESRIVLSSGDYNASEGTFGWSSSDGENVEAVSSLVKATFTIPANTPAGSYEIGIKHIEITADWGDIWEDSGTASATLTITDGTPAAGYTADINTVNHTVTKGDTVNVNIGINGAASYNAAEVKVSYDTGKVTFNETASVLGTAKVKAANGVVTLEDYGADKNTGNAVYTLAFTATADGEATFGLTSAMFSDKDSATKKDLTAATVTTASLDVTIEKPTFSVTLPDIFTGPSTITEGEDYTFSVADGSNFDYGTVTATMGDSPVTVIDNGNGTYTIKNVTGALVISGSRTAKSYTVTFSGNAASEVTGAATATYGTDYSFTIPTVTGWAYTLESVTIGSTAYTGYSVADGTYTIPGSAINGNIVVTVNKSQTTATVTVEGTGAGAAAGYAASANIGEAYTLTIAPVAGYDYTVTATMGGVATTVVDNKDNTYTIANVTGNIVFTVNQNANVDGVSVSKYLSLNGTNMWLVKNAAELADGSVATYDGEVMFWSDEYDAYCTLVIAEALTSEEAAAKVGITEAEKITVDYGMDVNMSEKVDANDAQLVYNMYNAMYNEFTADVTVEKFLRADTNGDAQVNVADATAIISSLLA